MEWRELFFFFSVFIGCIVVVFKLELLFLAELGSLFCTPPLEYVLKLKNGKKQYFCGSLRSGKAESSDKAEASRRRAE